MRFDVRTVADAQALSRVLEHFALRTLIPERVSAVRNGSGLDISVEIEGVDHALAELLIEKIRASVLVFEANHSRQSRRILDGVK